MQAPVHARTHKHMDVFGIDFSIKETAVCFFGGYKYSRIALATDIKADYLNVQSAVIRFKGQLRLC